MCTSIRSGRSGRSGRERSYQTDQTDQTDSEPRRSRPRIRARPAGLQIGIHVGRGFPLRLERLLQAEERPAVVRMLLEIDLVHLLCVGGPRAGGGAPGGGGWLVEDPPPPPCGGGGPLGWGGARPPAGGGRERAVP